MIEQENRTQLQEWGVQSAPLFEWLAWTIEEFGEFAQALNDFVYGRKEFPLNVTNEGIQTITLLMKILEIVSNIQDSIVRR